MNARLLAFAVVSIVALPASIPAADAPPNIVMIVSDDHHWGDYSFMGSKVVKTPNLDRLAAQSLVFPRGYVPSSLCCPSLVSMITGLFPHQHKVTSNDPPRPVGGISNAEFYASKAFQDGREVMNRHIEVAPTLPRLLVQKGYVSLQTGKWWQGHYSRGGFTHGMTQGGRHGDDGLEIGRKTMQPIFDFIAEARRDQKPFFVWYAPMLPHTPHTPPQRLLDRHLDKSPSPAEAKYRAMVEWFDETCGQLIDHLEQQNLSRNTIVVYLADNGWITDPETGRYAPRSKQSPYDGGLRTPILVRWLGKVTPRTSDRLATSLDIAPTLLAAAGIAASPTMSGLNLLDGTAVEKRTAVLGECFTHDSADLNDPAASLRWRWIIDGDWKLILPSKRNEPAAVPELYNVVQDPNEAKNLATVHTSRVAALTARLDSWWAASLPPAARAPTLFEWDRGFGLRIAGEPSADMYYWIYEWNMFGAMQPGQHTQGTYLLPRTLNADATEGVVDSPAFKLTLRAVADGAQLVLRITNTTDTAWSEIAGVIPCWSPGSMPGTSQYARLPLNVNLADLSRQKTFFVSVDGLSSLDSRALHFNAAYRVDAERVSDGGKFPFSYKWPTSEVNATAGLLVRESEDGHWVTGVAWEDFLSVQGHNPLRCMHACVRIGALKPGESRTVRGRLYLFPGRKEDCLARFQNEFPRKR